jgi:hypothetical protein
MSEDFHSLAVKWEFTTEANIEQLIEELAGVLETYAGLVGCSGVPDELARLLELAQDGKREVASAIENLSPLAQSLLNYPTPMPPLWKMSSARLSDEIISRLLKYLCLWTDGERCFTEGRQPIHNKQSEKLSNVREKILLKRVIWRLVMISTPLKSMMPDRPDMTQTVKIMSGPSYRTDRTHPLRGVLVSGANWVAHRYTELYFG